ncbi:MAG TPA: VOC family protein [Candidatus Kryptonia bacterium]|nr:VOC family protein [Candidatus Kryptonia bacterium]
MALVKKIDHLAIAVKDLEAAVQTYTNNFGFPVVRRGENAQLGLLNAFLQVGDAQLELFCPTKPENPATKFLAEQGEGMYVLSLEVDDLEQATRSLSSKGIKVGPITPIPDGRLAFISPKATHGVLLQFIEWKKGQ